MVKKNGIENILHIQLIFKITIILFCNYFILIYQKLRNIRMT